MRAGLPLNGLIPARAGNTFTITVTCRPWGGSSPLARGTPGVNLVLDGGLGLIPARAGNTVLLGCPRVNKRAHPRSRGEHRKTVPRGTAWTGSSPLARGTPRPSAFSSVSRGLIPARAGNTVHERTANVAVGAHPRSRGEHGQSDVRTPPGPGSSPLARGTRHPNARGNPKRGLIPARAGNTRWLLRRVVAAWAHPRSRGEHLSKDWHRAIAAGSSPLARGTHNNLGFIGINEGLIPARAGNTLWGVHRYYRAGAHPRSRGEH